MSIIKPAVSYQGSKMRIAPDIVETMEPMKSRFWDMCCGNGSISIYLVGHGIKSPKRIHMVDAGPWGLVWKAIGEGAFSLDEFKWWLSKIPDDKSKIKEFMEDLSKQRADYAFSTPYVYLILQAGSFGGKAIWIEENRWQNASFRNYWEPTPTSSRRYPVNPMMPMPDTLYERVSLLCEAMHGVSGIHANVESLVPRDATVYIDPQYDGRTKYGHGVNDVVSLAKTWALHGNDVFVSEGYAIALDAKKITGKRDKGGISGERKNKNEEWISFFQAEYIY